MFTATLFLMLATVNNGFWMGKHDSREETFFVVSMSSTWTNLMVHYT